MPAPLADAERRLRDGSLTAAHLAAVLADRPALPRADADNPRGAWGELALLARALGVGVEVPVSDAEGDALYPLTSSAEAWSAVAARPADPPEALREVDAWAWAAPDARTRAARWLESPARRLIHDLEVLAALRGSSPAEWDPGATSLDPNRLRACLAEALPWRLALPGEQGLTAPPAGPATDAAAVLRTLENPRPPSARGPALGWLLERAATSPLYDIPDGSARLTRDLREDLPIHLALAWSEDSTPGAGAAADVEDALLRHASAIADASPGWTVLDRWRLARWLQLCLEHSPFHQIDPRVLAIRLRALLPATPGTWTHALDPALVARLGASTFALLSGALRGARAAQPAAPAPLVNLLSGLAARPVTPDEQVMERLNLTGDDPLGWRKVAPVAAPTWVARWILTVRLNGRWLARCPVDAQRACLEAAGTDAKRYGWAAKAWYDEGASLPLAAVSVAREMLPTLHAPAWVGALVGAGIAAHLDDAELETALRLAGASEEWAPVVLDGLARAPAGRYPALTMLLDLAEGRNPPRLRVNAMLRALMVLDRESLADSAAVAEPAARARRIARAEPFLSQPQLQQVLGRLAG